MVFAQVDPHAVAKRENFINETVTDVDLNLLLNTHFKYDRKFIQGALPGEFITSVRKVNGDIQYVTEPVIFTVTKMDFENMTVLIPVYKCTERTLAEIRNLFPPERPWIVQGQSIEILQMYALLIEGNIITELKNH